MQEGFELTYEQSNSITKSTIAQLGYPYKIFSLKTYYEYASSKRAFCFHSQQSLPVYRDKYIK